MTTAIVNKSVSIILEDTTVHVRLDTKKTQMIIESVMVSNYLYIVPPAVFVDSSRSVLPSSYWLNALKNFLLKQLNS